MVARAVAAVAVMVVVMVMVSPWPIPLSAARLASWVRLCSRARRPAPGAAIHACFLQVPQVVAAVMRGRPWGGTPGRWPAPVPHPGPALGWDPRDGAISHPCEEKTSMGAPLQLLATAVPVEGEVARAVGVGSRHVLAHHHVALVRAIHIGPRSLQHPDGLLPLCTPLCTLRLAAHDSIKSGGPVPRWAH